jgi:hypothetical protein
MKYKSIDEIDTMEFSDATVVDMSFNRQRDVLELELVGVIVRENNQANDTYSERYASNMKFTFEDVDIEALLLEGHTYYDANENFVEKVPDVVIPDKQYESIFAAFKECPVFFAGEPKEKMESVDKKCFQMIVDVKDENDDEESYVLSFYYQKVTAAWEHFMNKVAR